MTINDIATIIRKEVRRKGYELEERKSASSDSWYFKIFSGDTSLMFRLSDHSTGSDVITLRIDKKLTERSIQGFINNRCQDLGRRRLKILLGM